ncbi:hypothetical protein HGA13_08405 [Nocardia speluncae]|uniref:Secreted protein n=1 Tax=Nocardia speluncae TaxID=419477 RepID=A0A846XD65_9NOCA|nr:hypothetical protein [Nocardia speluncae]NKY33089.1 hypothetical protein [Nocardia speluncae]
MSVPKRTARRLLIAGAVISGSAVVAVSTTVGAGAARALPPGDAFCSAVPVGSRLDIECTNTDVGAATAGVLGLCTNLRILHRPAERMRPESTIRWSEDCGPGAHPILWSPNARTDYDRLRDNERTRDNDF